MKKYERSLWGKQTMYEFLQNLQKFTENIIKNIFGWIGDLSF